MPIPLRRCKKCRAEKGTAHHPTCEVVRFPWAFTANSPYIPASVGSYTIVDTTSSRDTSSSPGHGGGSSCG